uniref:Uncharacterized protein n=1 Tax=uncultured marine virus TaxID=186617 RepID=A0A0F7L5D6_9VIRU|nr:hypothetical protein [uncultured marine virus]
MLSLIQTINSLQSYRRYSITRKNKLTLFSFDHSTALRVSTTTYRTTFSKLWNRSRCYCCNLSSTQGGYKYS